MPEIPHFISDIQPRPFQAPSLSPDALSAVPRALAQLGGDVQKTAEIVAAVQEKKQQTLDEAEVSRRATFLQAVGDEIERTNESLPDPRNHRTNVLSAFEKSVEKALGEATNKRVQDTLRVKVDAIRLDLFKRASSFENNLVVNEGRAALQETLIRLRRAAIQDFDPESRERKIGEAAEAVGAAVGTGLLKQDDGVKTVDQFRRDVQKGVAFRIGYDNPGEGWRLLVSGDIIFDDPNERRLFESFLERREAQITAAEEREARVLERKQKEAAASFASDALRRVDPLYDGADRLSLAELEQGLQTYSAQIPFETQRTLRDLALKPRREGGTTDPEVFNDIRSGILLGDPGISNYSIMRYAGKGLSVSDAQKLVEQWSSHQKSDDLSQTPPYRLAVRRITATFGGLTPFEGLAFFTNPQKAFRYQAALDEFDQRARKEPARIREIADEIILRESRRGDFFGGKPAAPTQKPQRGTGILNVQ